MEVKTCGKCKVEKSVREFAKSKSSKDCLHHWCRLCNSEYKKQYNKVNKEKLAGKRKTYREANKEQKAEYDKRYREANKEKILTEKKRWWVANREVQILRLKTHYEDNKEAINERAKQYREANKERLLEKAKQYRNTNRNKVTATKRRWKQTKRVEDFVFKFKEVVRSAVYGGITRSGYTKSSKTFAILGGSFEVVRSHLEAQFTEGMDWDTQGKDGWHIDHFIPVSYAKNEEEVLILNHYRNLQPLWATQNLTKSDSLPSIEEIRARGLEDIWEAVNCGY